MHSEMYTYALEKFQQYFECNVGSFCWDRPYKLVTVINDAIRGSMV